MLWLAVCPARGLISPRKAMRENPSGPSRRRKTVKRWPCSAVSVAEASTRQLARPAGSTAGQVPGESETSVRGSADGGPSARMSSTLLQSPLGALSPRMTSPSMAAGSAWSATRMGRRPGVQRASAGFCWICREVPSVAPMDVRLEKASTSSSAALFVTLIRAPTAVRLPRPPSVWSASLLDSVKTPPMVARLEKPPSVWSASFLRMKRLPGREVMPWRASTFSSAAFWSIDTVVLTLVSASSPSKLTSALLSSSVKPRPPTVVRLRRPSRLVSEGLLSRLSPPGVSVSPTSPSTFGRASFRKMASRLTEVRFESAPMSVSWALSRMTRRSTEVRFSNPARLARALMLWMLKEEATAVRLDSPSRF